MSCKLRENFWKNDAGCVHEVCLQEEDSPMKRKLCGNNDANAEPLIPDENVADSTSTSIFNDDEKLVINISAIVVIVISGFTVVYSIIIMVN